MTNDWTSYFREVNEKPASIFVNLGLRPDVPIVSNPWRLRVRICFRNPRADGLSHSEEAPTLFLIEDALNQQITQECQAITSGRITTDGRRDFCYYGKAKENFGPAVAAALARFPEYRYQLAVKWDPDWEYYLNALYPSREEIERVKNRDLLEVLAKEGDIATVAREVQHWIYFPSAESRQLFRHEVGNMGFAVGQEYESDSEAQGKLRFCLTVLRTQPIQQELMDQTVLELLCLAVRFGGDYDGWETPVTTQ